MAAPFHQQVNNTSSVFQKLDPELRRRVDICIIERWPPTYQGIWMEQKLGEHGVTYSSFYRYARRLRDRANLAEIAGLADDDAADLDEPIRKLISRRLVELLLHTDDMASIKEAATLLTAHCQGARIALLKNRQKDQSRIAWARVEIERETARRRIADPSRRELPPPPNENSVNRVRKLLEELSSEHSDLSSDAKANPSQSERAVGTA